MSTLLFHRDTTGRAMSTTEVHRQVRKDVRREGHELVLYAQGNTSVVALAAEAVQSKLVFWWKALRKGQLHIYGSLLRYIDIAIIREVPKEMLLRIPEVIRAYIEEEHRLHARRTERR